MAQATGLLYLKAAHSETAAVQPADITIYMGGTSGYEGVAEEDGTISGSNSLPESGYYITLSDSGDAALQAAGLIHGNKPANLSEYIPLHTVGTEGERVSKSGVAQKNGLTADGKGILPFLPPFPVAAYFRENKGGRTRDEIFSISSADTGRAPF